MRGKLLFVHLYTVLRRITPAHAGKTTTGEVRFSFVQDHPRPCGENGWVSKTSTMPEGSPPPMRGKHHGHIHCHAVGRITPAHAGKTPTLLGFDSPVRDHPRPCGENCTLWIGEALPLGSPPPMRGKQCLKRGSRI